MKVLVVEDSRLARNELVRMLQEVNEIDQILQAENAMEAKRILQHNDLDILFLDINLPGMNGFDLLQSLDYSPPVIFTTAYDEYAIKAFEFNTIDYLMKPIGDARLRKAIAKIKMDEQSDKSEKLNPSQKVFVRDGDKCWFVKVSDIRLFESVGNYAKVYFENFNPLILKSLNYLESILDQKYFFRASRQHIINLRFIKSVRDLGNQKLAVTLTTGEVIEISRRQSANFKQMYSL